MKIPKSVNICGKRYTVKLNPEHDGGSGDSEKLLIEVGTSDPSEVAENLVHEIGEMIMATRDFRYVPEKDDEFDNGDYRFFLNHKDWELFAKDLSIALQGIKFDK